LQIAGEKREVNKGKKLMDLKNYIFPLRKWWWLMAIATIIAAAFSYYAVLQQPPIYNARTTLMIGRAIEDPNPSANQFGLGQQLAVFYADIANRELVRDASMAELGWRYLPEYRARALPNSQLIEIVVTDTNPERAQLVANEIAKQLILLSPTGSRPDEQTRIDFVNEQLNLLEGQIKETEQDIQNLQMELGNLISARQINDVQNQIAALQAKRTTLQGHYAALLSNTRGGAINTLTVIEPAALPTRPVASNMILTVLLSAGIGFTLAATAAYLLEYLDKTLKTPEEISRLVPAPILAHFFDTPEWKSKNVLVLDNPRHPALEAFRTLRTNIEFANAVRPLRTILVSSAETDEGKTSIAVNLAAVMAHADKRVVLLDLDLRKPTVHAYLKIPNEDGLSEVFRNNLPINTSLKKWLNGRVLVATAGEPPPNPTELVGSKRMDQIMERLTEMADVVIIDGPPFLVADASVLASKVDGVLLVVRPGYTQKAAAETMMEQIKLAGVRLVGVVLNRIPRKGADYYAGNRYISQYYTYTQEETNHSWSIRGNGHERISMESNSMESDKDRTQPLSLRKK
jgi:capsular exopolysaccharide synthesis family protein